MLIRPLHLGLTLSFALGLVAPTAITQLSAAPPSVTSPAVQATTTAQQTILSRTNATTLSSCRGTKDSRTTAAAKKTPFKVCGIIVISKKHRVTSAYHPTLTTVKVRANGPSKVRLQPVAGKALKKMFSAAKKAGYTLTVRAAYRSYSTQKSVYHSGSTLVAPAGASEHQSGLAVDLAWVRNGSLVRGFTFGTSKAGKWVRAHAASYGFILRYPKNARKITGISYEPWHFRYVGVSAAKGVNATASKTLEKYLQIS